MLSAFRNVITRIQHAEEPVRRRWLFVFSGASMLIVIALWVGYVQFIISAPDTTAVFQKEVNESNFGEIFGAGIGAVSREARSQWSVTHRILIERPEENFQLSPEKLPPIPSTSLR